MLGTQAYLKLFVCDLAVAILIQVLQQPRGLMTRPINRVLCAHQHLNDLMVGTELVRSAVSHC